MSGREAAAASTAAGAGQVPPEGGDTGRVRDGVFVLPWEYTHWVMLTPD